MGGILTVLLIFFATPTLAKVNLTTSSFIESDGKICLDALKTGIFPRARNHLSSKDLLKTVFHRLSRRPEGVAAIDRLALSDKEKRVLDRKELLDILQYTDKRTLEVLGEELFKIQFRKFSESEGFEKANANHVDDIQKISEMLRPPYLRAVNKILPEATESDLEHLLLFRTVDVIAHDGGKTVADRRVMNLAKKLVGNLSEAQIFAKTSSLPPETPLKNRITMLIFLYGRLALHEVSSATLVTKIIRLKKLDLETGKYLIRAFTGHNEGSGLRQVWWNNVAFDEEVMGFFYGEFKPETFHGAEFSVTDRGPQGTGPRKATDPAGAILSRSGGVYKILLQELVTRGQPFTQEVIQDKLYTNGKNTIEQIAQNAKAVGYRYAHSPEVMALKREQYAAMRLYAQIEWDILRPGHGKFVIGPLKGKSFENWAQFEELVFGPLVN